MKILSIIFIISTFYYLLQRVRLQTPAIKRQYKSKFLVYVDIIYFLSHLTYYFWFIALSFVSINFFLLFFILGLCRWFMLRPENEKLDYSFCVLKICLLSSFFIS